MGVALRSSVRRYNFVKRKREVAVLKPNLSLSVSLSLSFSLFLPIFERSICPFISEGCGSERASPLPVNNLIVVQD